MLLKVATALKLTIPFILGILYAYFFTPSFISAFSVWFGGIITLAVVIGNSRSVFATRKWIGMLLILVFFLSGILGYSARVPQHQFTHYSKHYLPGDSLKVEIQSYQKSTGNFDRAILSVDKLITPHHVQEVTGNLLAFVNNKKRLKPGHTFVIGSPIAPITNTANPGEFNQELFWKSKGVHELVFIGEGAISQLDYAPTFSSFWYSARTYLERQLQQQLEGEALALALALSLGDKYLLSNELRTSFANAGAMHVLAVSGLHVGILLFLLTRIFSLIPPLRKKNIYLICSILILWCYAFLTGLSPSVFRAVLMFTIMALGQLRGASFLSLNSLLISALLLLFINPNYLFDIGFQLSYLAMLGIIFFYSSIRDLIVTKYKVINYFWEGTAIGIAAQIGTLPISLYYFHQFPNYFIITNLALMVLSIIALSAVLLFFCVHFIPGINTLFSLIINYVMESIVSVVHFVDQLPYAVAKGFNLFWAEVIIAYFLIAFIWWTTEKRKLRTWFIAASVLFLFGGLVQYQRYNTIHQKELVVYNDTAPIVSWREKGQIYCFYPEEKINHFNRIDNLLNNYAKLSGATIEYIPYSTIDEITLLKSDKVKLSLKVNHQQLTLQIPQHRILLPFYASRLKDTKEKEVIILPGNYTKGKIEKINHSTHQEAFIINL